MIVVRAARPQDAADVARIYIDSWNAGFGEIVGMRTHTNEQAERWRDDLAESAITWTVAQVDGAAVGFAGVGPSRDPVDAGVGELETIAVDPACWRQGVGRSLMAQAVDQLVSTYDSAILWTVTGYERGDAFYRSTGWSPLGWRRRNGAETAYHLAQLPAPTPPAIRDSGSPQSE